MSQIEFGYWPFKGRAEGLRYLLNYLGSNYTEYNPVDVKDWSTKRSQLTGNYPLMNLPYINIGDVTVSETPAVGMALCLFYKRKDLLGKTGSDCVHHRGVQELIARLRSFAFQVLTFDSQEIKEDYDKVMKSQIYYKIKGLDAFKMPSNDFIFGYLTLADFELCHAIELLDWISEKSGCRNPIADFPGLYKVKDAVKNLPGVGSFARRREGEDWLPESAVTFLVDQGEQGLPRSDQKVGGDEGRGHVLQQD